MWIATLNGFFSVVHNRDARGPHDALLVRARVRTDIDRLAGFSEERGLTGAVTQLPQADYPYRLTTSREIFSAFLAREVDGVIYPNFKNAVAANDPVRAHVYMKAWGAFLGLFKVDELRGQCRHRQEVEHEAGA